MTLNITPDSASGVPVKAVGPPTTLRDIRKGVSLYFEHELSRIMEQKEKMKGFLGEMLEKSGKVTEVWRFNPKK